MARISFNLNNGNRESRACYNIAKGDDCGVIHFKWRSEIGNNNNNK